MAVSAIHKLLHTGKTHTEKKDTTKEAHVAHAVLSKTTGHADTSHHHREHLPRTTDEVDVSQKHLEPEFETPRTRVEGHHGLPTCDSELLRRDGKI